MQDIELSCRPQESTAAAVGWARQSARPLPPYAKTSLSSFQTTCRTSKGCNRLYWPTTPNTSRREAPRQLHVCCIWSFMPIVFSKSVFKCPTPVPIGSSNFLTAANSAGDANNLLTSPTLPRSRQPRYIVDHHAPTKTKLDVLDKAAPCVWPASYEPNAGKRNSLSSPGGHQREWTRAAEGSNDCTRRQHIWMALTKEQNQILQRETLVTGESPMCSSQGTIMPSSSQQSSIEQHGLRVERANRWLTQS